MKSKNNYRVSAILLFIYIFLTSFAMAQWSPDTASLKAEIGLYKEKDSIAEKDIDRFYNDVVDPSDCEALKAKLNKMLAKSRELDTTIRNCDLGIKYRPGIFCSRRFS